MNKLSALALGTALALSMPLAAVAQETDTSVELDTEVGVGAGDELGVDAGVETGVDAGVDVDAAQMGDPALSTDVELSGYTYGDLDAALQGAAAADLTGITADTEIEIVTLSSLADEDEFTATAFGETRADFTADIGTLQSGIEDNADLVAALEAEGYTSEDVVGVWSQADGSLTVFVDDAGDPRFPDSELPVTDDTATPGLTPETDATAPETDPAAPETGTEEIGVDGTVETETEGEVTAP